MKRKILAILCIFVLVTAMSACSSEEETEETTLTGMVASIDGTVISLVEMDSTQGSMNFENGEMPSRPENMEGFEGFEDFEGFEGFDGTFPEGESFPQWGDGETPAFPEGEMPEMPTGEDGETMELPTDENGQMQRPGGMSPDFGDFEFEGETTQIDIANAHISVEIDGGKASGTLEDITPGSFVTITRNSKGEVTNILVSSQSGFGGIGSFGGRGDKKTEGSQT